MLHIASCCTKAFHYFSFIIEYLVHILAVKLFINVTKACVKTVRSNFAFNVSKYIIPSISTCKLIFCLRINSCTISMMASAYFTVICIVNRFSKTINKKWLIFILTNLFSVRPNPFICYKFANIFT